jgi:serine protease Do
MKVKAVFAIMAMSLLIIGSCFAFQEVHILGSGSRSFLGVGIRDVSEDDVQNLSLEREQGVLITSVENDSPASEAGIEEGDVVTEYAGIPVLSARHFQRLVSETPSGRTVTLAVFRDGRIRNIDAEIAERRHSQRFMHRAPEVPEFKVPDFDFALPRGERGVFVYQGGARLGIQAVALTEQMAEFLDVAKGEGVLVMEVSADSAAEKAGLKAGDVITAVDGKEVSDPSELRRRLTDGEQELSIVREGRPETVDLTLGSEKKSRSSGIRM